MRLLIAGGTGRAGRALARRAVAAGHDVRVLSRSGTALGIDGARAVRGDVITGTGLAAAMTRVEAVVDVTNIDAARYRRASAFFRTGSSQLITAERDAGVRHHVVLSIVGIDKFPGGYYRAKVDQERTALACSAEARIPCTIARVTQFHDFAAITCAAGRVGPLIMVPPLHLRPVHLDDVADHLLGVLARQQPGPARELSGPQLMDLDEMVARYVALTGVRARILRLPLPGGWGRANAAHVLVGNGRHGSLTFDHWLAEQRAEGRRPPIELDPVR